MCFRDLKEPKVKKEKKRKHKENMDEVDGTSPVKKTKNVNQSEELNVNQSSEKLKISNQTTSSHENLNDAVDSETTDFTPKNEKSKEHKKKAEHSEMNISVDNCPEELAKDLNITEESGELDQSVNTPLMTGSSKKRQKKNKNKNKKRESTN